MSAKKYIMLVIWCVLLCICVLIAAVVVEDLILYEQDESNVEKLNNSTSAILDTAEGSQDIVKFSETHLYIEDTNINYDIVQGEDNEYYLTHTPDGKYNKAGWLFFDYRVKASSKNKIIYGHNRVTGSMFGSLTNLTSSSYYDKNGLDTIHLIENEKDIVYRVFAVYTTDIDFDYLRCNFEDNDDFKQYIESIRIKNAVALLNDVQVKSEDSIITLSTCAGEDRLVVQAVRVIEDDKDD